MNRTTTHIPSYIRPTTLALALLCAIHAMAGHAAEQGAGTLLQEMTPGVPLSIPSAPPTLNSGSQFLPAGQSQSNIRFEVKSFDIVGNTVFGASVLHDLVQSAEGASHTLSELSAIAQRITDYYHAHGYPFARAMLPAQTIRAGVVIIKVVEPRYESLTVDNHSEVRDGLLQATLDHLQSGQQIEQDALNRTLLLLSDIPGTLIDATMKPGTKGGTSDLTVVVNPSQSYVGSASLDNYGNAYTGDVRAGVNASIFNPLHQGDILTLSAMSSGAGMTYGRVGYELLVDGTGTRVGADYSLLHYTLGGALAPLQGHGTADVADLWVKHPFIRSKTLNVYAQLLYNYENLVDDLDVNSIEDARHLNDVTASLSGDSRDMLWSGGVNTWNISATSGRVSFDNQIAQISDASTVMTQGQFTKWNATFIRLQNVSTNNALYFSLNGQVASKNLDPSQQMIAGGPFSVRAYDMGILSGDDGVLFTTEFRHEMGGYMQGQLTGIAFVDAEYITINEDPWLQIAGNTNTASLEGAGVGFNWNNAQQWNVKCYLATPFGSTPNLIGTTDKSLHAWLGIIKGF